MNPELNQIPITPVTSDLTERIRLEIGQNVYLCYQCVKCTSGCPVAEFLDLQPNQVMRALQLGQTEMALQAQTPWLCASCQTCSTRCPQGLDITAIMEFLTRACLAAGIKPPVPQVNIFNEAFMREIRLWGRAYELGLMAEIKLRTGDLTGDLDLGWKMLQKQKLAFLPKIANPSKNPRPVPGAGDAVAYYPGCSLHSTAAEFDLSTRRVCEALDLKLIEPAGWVCCGSSAAHRANPTEALRLPFENLSMIEQSGFREVAMPCAACFNRHKAALHEYRQHSEYRPGLEKQVNYAYRDTLQVNTMVEAILKRVGAAGVAKKVERPLKDVKLVCYYGCLLTRPPQVTEAEHPENPVDMDQLMAALGAQVLDWSYKTSCCGAAHSLTRPDIVHTLSRNLLDQARLAGAEAIVVACPLCHTNLDARQFQMELPDPMPVLYFTQLMAIALGLPDEAAALHKNLVDPRPFLIEKNLFPAS